jgi:hypothetical protein
LTIFRRIWANKIKNLIHFLFVFQSLF